MKEEHKQESETQKERRDHGRDIWEDSKLPKTRRFC
tara:strand:- start:728 stop:835 length:108 start_codon:yes stop_codon:yes gene_type:complete